jgi:hypothetical protein
MSVENKIKELLDRAGQKQQQLTEESKEDLTAGGIADIGVKAASNMSRDTSKAGKAAVAGDATQPRQGSSKDASFTTSDEDDTNLGAKNASSISKDTTLPKSKGDAKSVKVPAMEEEQVDGEETILESENDLEISKQLNSIFGEELSEEFKTKATSIFEAAVIARVNNEMDRVTSKLEEQAAQELVEFKEAIVDKVDSYLNYVVEQWMEENQLAVESGLRTEIAEDFMTGLKTLFKEHYIDVPEEKYDVLGELQVKTDELESKLNEAIESNVAASKELAELKASKIIEEQTRGLADTEVEKLKKLVEGVDFENENLYREKVSVIKENYFPKAPKTSPEKVLVEDSTGNNASFASNDTMARYASAISRSVKNR